MGSFVLLLSSNGGRDWFDLLVVVFTDLCVCIGLKARRVQVVSACFLGRWVSFLSYCKVASLLQSQVPYDVFVDCGPLELRTYLFVFMREASSLLDFYQGECYGGAETEHHTVLARSVCDTNVATPKFEKKGAGIVSKAHHVFAISLVCTVRDNLSFAGDMYHSGLVEHQGMAYRKDGSNSPVRPIEGLKVFGKMAYREIADTDCREFSSGNREYVMAVVRAGGRRSISDENSLSIYSSIVDSKVLDYLGLVRLVLMGSPCLGSLSYNYRPFLRVGYAYGNFLKFYGKQSSVQSRMSVFSSLIEFSTGDLLWVLVDAKGLNVAFQTAKVIDGCCAVKRTVVIGRTDSLKRLLRLEWLVGDVQYLIVNLNGIGNCSVVQRTNWVGKFERVIIRRGVRTWSLGGRLSPWLDRWSGDFVDADGFVVRHVMMYVLWTFGAFAKNLSTELYLTGIDKRRYSRN